MAENGLDTEIADTESGLSGPSVDDDLSYLTDDPEPETPETSTEPEKLEEPAAPESNVELTTLKDQVAALTAQLQYLQTEDRSQPAPEPDEPIPDEPEIDEQQLLAGLRTNPTKTIKSLIKTYLQHDRESLKDSILKEARNASEQERTVDRENQQDANKVAARFGPMLEQSTEFRQQANRHYITLTKERGYFPGALYSAAAAAFSELSLDGKLKPKVASATPRSAPTIFGDGTTNSQGNAIESEFTAFQLRGIDAACARLSEQTGKKVTRKDWLARIASRRNEDPSFGR